MNYQPKILYNPTNNDIEVWCGGRIYQYTPGEKRLEDGPVAYHILNHSNSALVEYDGQDSNPESLPLDAMGWRELVSLGSKLGVFKPPMNREALVKAIKDGPEAGIIPEPTNQEEV